MATKEEILDELTHQNIEETSKRVFYTLTADKTVDTHRIARAFAFLIEHLEDEGILEVEDIDDLLFYAVS
jgi:hypothetical protein